MGGTAIAIRKEISHRRLNVRITLQVIALSVYLVVKTILQAAEKSNPKTSSETKRKPYVAW